MIALCIAFSLIVLFAFAFLTAPEGYQDETGFHFGKEPRP